KVSLETPETMIELLIFAEFIVFLLRIKIWLLVPGLTTWLLRVLIRSDEDRDHLLITSTRAQQIEKPGALLGLATPVMKLLAPAGDESCLVLAAAGDHLCDLLARAAVLKKAYGVTDLFSASRSTKEIRVWLM